MYLFAHWHAVISNSKYHLFCTTVSIVQNQHSRISWYYEFVISKPRWADIHLACLCNAAVCIQTENKQTHLPPALFKILTEQVHKISVCGLYIIGVQIISIAFLLVILTVSICLDAIIHIVVSFIE